jgi:hypothetical protein
MFMLRMNNHLTFEADNYVLCVGDNLPESKVYNMKNYKFITE